MNHVTADVEELADRLLQDAQPIEKAKKRRPAAAEKGEGTCRTGQGKAGRQSKNRILRSIMK